MIMISTIQYSDYYIVTINDLRGVEDKPNKDTAAVINKIVVIICH